MKKSSELLTRIMMVISRINSRDEQLDDLSRSIFLQIAKAEANDCNLRIADVVRNSDATAPTVYGRLKNLVELGLIRAITDPSDGRAQLLSLTPIARKKIKKAAEEIRQVCQD